MITNTMINQIVKMIRDGCDEAGVNHPDLFTEFGKIPLEKVGATIFSVLEQKQQNDSEIWYMVDNSLMNTLPDSWDFRNDLFCFQSINGTNDYSRINIGGLDCDNSDYYNTEATKSTIVLPRYSRR